MLRPVTIEKFGGLNLASDSSELGPNGASDLVNVDFDRLGRVHTRDGYTRVAAITMTTPHSLAAHNPFPSTGHLIAGYTVSGTERLTAYTRAGASVATQNVTSGYITGSAMAGDATDTRLYLANGVDTLWRWDGSSFTQPAGMPKGTRLAVAPKSGRLVTADIFPSNLSRVMFSDPENPEVWGADDYVDLIPGDGAISALATWQEYLFAFKNNRFFVFYGEGTDSSGGAVFTYRGVDGYGALDAASGLEGVYFTDGRTVWVTTGNTPRRISEPIEPFLRGEVPVDGVTVDQAAVYGGLYVSYALERLYVSVPVTGGGVRTLVFDPTRDTWTLYSTDLATIRTSQPSANPQAFFLSAAGLERMGGTTTDNGAAIAWSYTSGFYDLGSPAEKKVRFTDLYGSGTPTVQLLTRGARASDVADTGGAVTLGTAPAVARGRRARSARGRQFAHKLTGTGTCTVSRLDYLYLPPGSAA